MRNSPPLSHWDSALATYLSSRRALGRSYIPEECVLRALRAFLARAGADDLTGPLFDRWRCRSSHLSTSTRLREERTVYKFCLYRRRTERRCFLPDPLSFVRLKPYPLPMILGREHVARLLAACLRRRRGRRFAFHGAVMRLAIVLLYTAGLRRGELVRLTFADVNAAAGVLRIQDSKFHKSRWVPLSASATKELQTYLRVRATAPFDRGPNAPLLCTLTGRPYSGSLFWRAFNKLCVVAGVRGDNGRCPRPHDMRHSSGSRIIPATDERHAYFPDDLAIWHAVMAA
jgi:integrase